MRWLAILFLTVHRWVIVGFCLLKQQGAILHLRSASKVSSSGSYRSIAPGPTTAEHSKGVAFESCCLVEDTGKFHCSQEPSDEFMLLLCSMVI